MTIHVTMGIYYMACNANPIIAFPWIRTTTCIIQYIYILLYIFAPVSHIHVCIVYVHVVKEVISLRGARSISGQACNRMCTRALQTSRKNSSYVKTVTKSCSS